LLGKEGASSNTESSDWSLSSKVLLPTILSSPGLLTSCGSFANFTKEVKQDCLSDEELDRSRTLFPIFFAFGGGIMMKYGMNKKQTPSRPFLLLVAPKHSVSRTIDSL
jgi:hypothetical protein